NLGRAQSIAARGEDHADAQERAARHGNHIHDQIPSPDAKTPVFRDTPMSSIRISRVGELEGGSAAPPSNKRRVLAPPSGARVQSTRSTKRRLRKRRERERGIALVMVVGAIAVLTVMLAEMQDSTSAEAASAMADRDSTQAEYMAKSALNLARLLVATE